MTMMTEAYNDRPIRTPEDDRYGLDPFAKAIAQAFMRLSNPEGSVVAINGPWGSGKSSAVNLVRHHLAAEVDSRNLTIINFACWWFRGEESLALAFFRELYVGLRPALGRRLKRTLPEIGARLVKAGPAMGSVLDSAGAGGFGNATGRLVSRLAEWIKDDKTVESLHAELSALLASQERRFLVVIDDIDRLAPDEALLIFRLVKSAGRLPNVMYLLAYDRDLAERVVSERYPSEGPHYLEKIVQASFQLPEPTQTDLREHALGMIESICGEGEDQDTVEVLNQFYETVAPAMRTPRDVMRFANTLAVTWPVVADEVHLGDFLAMEALRLHHPGVHKAIQQNKQRLCMGVDHPDATNRDKEFQRYEQLLLGSVEEDEKEGMRKSLIRLFPRLQGIWCNVHYSGAGERWARERRVCSPKHFDTYFRFTLSADTLSKAEIDEFIQKAGDPGFTKTKVRELLATERRTGGTLAALLFEELNVHAPRISIADAQALLEVLFELGDELDVKQDHAEGLLNFADNQLRLHWLLRALILDRTTLEERSALFMSACRNAALGWLVNFADSAYMDHHPREGKEPEPDERCLTTADDASALIQQCLDRLREAARTGEIADANRLLGLLHRWGEYADDGGDEVRAWTGSQLEDDAMVIRFAEILTRQSWSHGLDPTAGLSDHVARPCTRINLKGLDTILDTEVFRRRLEEIEASGREEHRALASDFIERWNRQEADPDGSAG